VTAIIATPLPHFTVTENKKRDGSPRMGGVHNCRHTVTGVTDTRKIYTEGKGGAYGEQAQQKDNLLPISSHFAPLHV